MQMYLQMAGKFKVFKNIVIIIISPTKTKTSWDFTFHCDIIKLPYPSYIESIGMHRIPTDDESG
jgi:hypothetical protein